jgi:hypothetical protein
MGRSYELSLANKFFDYIHAGLPVIFTEFVEYKTINTEFNIGVMIEKTDVQQLVRVILNFENNFKMGISIYQCPLAFCSKMANRL